MSYTQSIPFSQVVLMVPVMRSTAGDVRFSREGTMLEVEEWLGCDTVTARITVTIKLSFFISSHVQPFPRYFRAPCISYC
jgi:hypothetical protein